MKLPGKRKSAEILINGATRFFAIIGVVCSACWLMGRLFAALGL